MMLRLMDWYTYSLVPKLVVRQHVECDGWVKEICGPSLAGPLET